MNSRSVFVDSGTLQDLEIVPTATTRGTTLWSLVDRTRTRTGRAALRARLLAPPRAADEILDFQRAHQVLAAESDSYRTALDRADADGVERYLNVTWQLPCDMPRLIRARRWYRQYVQDVADGQTRVAALFQAADELRERLGRADSAVLQNLGKQFAALNETPETRELGRLASRESATARRAFDQAARGHARPVLGNLLEYVGRLEALWSLGAATTEHGWSYPRPSSRLRASGLSHPFLAPHGVPNDLHLDDRVRVCFVTGPNMAGKSTFLRAVAIAVLLAHAGCGVPAVSMEFPTVGTVFSSVHIIDNASDGESFYLTEVRRIAALAAALAEHGSAVAVVDEPFRGTNVHDAAEATLAVISRLVDHPAALVLVASHLGEVVPAIVDDPRIALLYFAADMSADVPRFDYRLREGVSAQRLGMTLLRQERVLDLLERSVESADVQRLQ